MEKIMIIKLGAKGDVVRTLSILPAVKDKYPESHITWVTKENMLDLLENQPLIDEVSALPYQTSEKFDALYNFDIEEEATSLAKQIQADKKYGFSSEDGFPSTFNLGAEYYLNTLFDDELKKTNKKTYQEMMFDAAELPYEPHNKEPVKLNLSENALEYADTFLNENSLNKGKLIGIHMGASPRWPSKACSKEKIKQLILKLKEKNYDILLFGGPDEIQSHEKLINDLKQEGVKVAHNNPNNTDREFASLLNLCSKVVCSDSFSLHTAMALQKPTVCLFFCTSPAEVEEYGLLKKIVSPKLDEFFPEKMDQYDEALVNSISVEEVLRALEEN